MRIFKEAGLYTSPPDAEAADTASNADTAEAEDDLWEDYGRMSLCWRVTIRSMLHMHMLRVLA